VRLLVVCGVGDVDGPVVCGSSVCVRWITGRSFVVGNTEFITMGAGTKKSG
jgi:hypothetical protein